MVLGIDNPKHLLEDFMLEKVTVKFEGEIGSNEVGTTRDELIQRLLEIENEFNVKNLTKDSEKPHCRLHLSLVQE